jgi:hypothetical protein
MRTASPIKLLTISFVVGAATRILAASVEQVYFNDFNGSEGASYKEWSSSVINYSSRGNPPGSGTLPAPVVTNTVSPNGGQRFLGLFGGPQIGAPGDPGYNQTRVYQTIRLALTNLPSHRWLTVSFDLYIVRSWDGNSPAHGPDTFSLSAAGGPRLLETTFSNNPKTAVDGSFQNYPVAHSAPWTGAAATNTLGYDRFFRDSTYHLRYSFAHAEHTVTMQFGSSLFEGKGIGDEAWGLDNVRIEVSAGEERRPTSDDANKTR